MAAEQRRDDIFCSIQNTLIAANRCLESEEVNHSAILADLRQAQRLVSVIDMAEESSASLSTMITTLIEHLEAKLASKNTDTSKAFVAPREKTGRPGRPKVDISMDQLRLFYQLNYTEPQMASEFGCSTKLIHRKLYEAGLSLRQRFAVVSDEELDRRVADLQKKFPNAGSVMMSGFLQAEGFIIQRQRLRESMRRVSPVPVLHRLSRTTKRRHYSVQMSNSLWHIDGHMKLIRWGISTHGGIDGYSRLITFLHAATDNKSTTVLGQFLEACNHYGIPSRVRSDHGGENVLVALFMNFMNEDSRHSHITGRSVHNQRIERLWRDVFTQVIEKHYTNFYSLEDRGVLDADNVLHIFALQAVYLPAINGELDLFRHAWNQHKLSTENNQTPHQLWLNGVLQNVNSDATPVQNMRHSFSREMIDARLRHHGLDPNAFSQDEVEPAQEVLTLEEKQNMLTAVPNDLSLEESFQKCLEYLTRSGHLV